MKTGSPPDVSSFKDESLLLGNGPIVKHIADLDWSETPLGPMITWPQSFKTALGIALHSDTPKLLVWGSDLLTFYNDSYAKGMGRLQGEGIGQPFPKFRPQAWRIARKYFEAALKGKGETIRDLPVPTMREEAETTVYLTISTTPVFDERGRIAGVLCDILERTGQVEMERQLRRENERFRQIFDAAPVFVALGSINDYRFEYANKAYEDLIGNRSVEGKVVWEVLPEAEAQGFVDLLRLVESTGDAFQGRDVPYRRTSDAGVEVRYIDFIYQPIKDADGKVTRIVCVGHDVTEEHEARDRARILTNQLNQAARLNAMGTMAATLAHELNQPLTAASNFLAGCQRLAAGAKETELLRQGLIETGDQIMRAAEIIRRARSLLSDDPSARVPVSLREIIQRALKVLVGDPSCDQAVFDIDVGEEADWICVDPVQIEQVLSNLIRNACQAAGQGAKIKVRGRPDKDRTRVAVIDNGPGFDVSLASVFENFGMSTEGGMGLGLAITRTIVEAHGSRIETCNRKGGGAVVEFTLARANPEDGR